MAQCGSADPTVSEPTSSPLAAACVRLLPRLRQVALDRAAVSKLAARLVASPPPLPDWLHPSFPGVAGRQLDCVVLLGNVINFSYWVDDGPMWQVQVAGHPEVDAFGAFGALHNALIEGVDLCHGPTLETFAPTLSARGEGVLPLTAERVAMLRYVAAVLSRELDGRLEHLMHALPRDVTGMAERLVELLPRAFSDEREFEGVRLPFLKRAQLAAGMLHAARVARGADGLTGLDQLTLYADYMLPRTLRFLGVLVYDAPLSRQVDTGVELPVGCGPEVEIRIATVAAGQAILEAVRAQGGQLDALRLDHALWRAGLRLTTPHHRARTTDY